MSLLTLHTDESGWLGADRLVFGADEVVALDDAVATARRLGELERTRTERLDEEARRGVEAGRLEGIESGRRESVERIAESLEALSARQTRADERRVADVADLALDVVRRIAPSIPIERWLAALAHEAAREAIDAPRRVLRVHPDRAPTVEAALDELGGGVFDAVRTDESLDPDAAEIDVGAGSLRVDLDTQLTEIARALGDGAR